MKQILIIGGGASGLMAAVSAAEAGAKVCVLERNKRAGKKLLLTGNGRCNYTNRNFSGNVYHGKNPDFAAPALKKFSPKDTIAFFHKLGIEPWSEPGEQPNGEPDSRVFPQSQQAGSILDALRFEAERLDVEIKTEFDIISIKTDGQGFIATGQTGDQIKGASVILACGGPAASGGAFTGYKLAESLGHRLTRLFPSLVQLTLQGKLHKAMEGMRWEGSIALYEDIKLVHSISGDILFTDYGISGQSILKLSRRALEGIQNGKQIQLSIGLLPNAQHQEVIDRLKIRVTNHPERNIEDLLLGWINKRIAMTLLKSLELNLSSKVSTLGDMELESIANRLTDWRFGVTGHNGWQNAQVTAGGVDTDEIDPKTLMSKKKPGLFLCGEILDIDGDSGGYNLQWAWSSGRVAGQSAAMKIIEKS